MDDGITAGKTGGDVPGEQLGDELQERHGNRSVCGVHDAGDAEGGEFDHGFFVTPTVVSGLPEEHRLVREELFLPLLYLAEVDSLDEAIEDMASRGVPILEAPAIDSMVGLLQLGGRRPGGPARARRRAV